MWSRLGARVGIVGELHYAVEAAELRKNKAKVVGGLILAQSVQVWDVIRVRRLPMCFHAAAALRR